MEGATLIERENMKTATSTAITKYWDGKKQWLRLAKITNDPKMRQIYLTSASYCDKQLTSIQARLRKYGSTCLIILAIGCLSGCATVRGLGGLMSGIGEDLQRAAGGYDQKQMEKEVQK